MSDAMGCNFSHRPANKSDYLTIYKIRDKFDAYGTVANKKKSGRNKTHLLKKMKC